MVAVLAIGSLFGFAAARGTFDRLLTANAAPAGSTEVVSGRSPASGCCSQGDSRSERLAVAAHNEHVSAALQKSGKKPNICIIWGDDIGQSNIAAYTHGLMGVKTPNIDRVAREGMMFTDYYGEQSCTAGRASFITGQHGLRTGLTKVGLPGATLGLLC